MKNQRRMKRYNEEDGIELLAYVRNILETEFNPNKIFYAPKSICEKYTIMNGVFVSLYNCKILRACLGKIISELPLYRTIEIMTIAAATKDYRFDNIKADELDELSIELSILTPMIKIQNISEIVIGKHGIYVEKQGFSGTFLPQVSIDQNWTIEEFLGHCSESKVGIGWDGWRDANIFIYESMIFSE